MEDGILRGVSGVDVLHEGGEVPIRGVVGGHEVSFDHLGRESRVGDHMGDMEADFAVLHVQFEFAQGHAVVGSGDELGHGGAKFLVTDEEGVVGTDLEVVPVVSDPGREAKAGIPAAHGEGHPVLLWKGRVVEVLGIQVGDDGIEGS